MAPKEDFEGFMIRFAKLCPFSFWKCGRIAPFRSDGRKSSVSRRTVSQWLTSQFLCEFQRRCELCFFRECQSWIEPRFGHRLSPAGFGEAFGPRFGRRSTARRERTRPAFFNTPSYNVACTAAACAASGSRPSQLFDYHHRAPV